MAEAGKRIIIGLFELDKNKASMPVPVGEERDDPNFELDLNDAITPRDTELE